MNASPSGLPAAQTVRVGKTRPSHVAGRADSSGARFAIIIGPEELAAGEVSLKPLRAADAQVRIAPTRVAGIIQQSV